MRFNSPICFPSRIVLSATCLFALTGTGYGQFKDPFHQPQTMILVRKLPPIINVKEGSFRIEASKTAGVSADVVDTLVTRTRGLLLKDRDRSLRLDDANPNFTLRCKVTGFEIEERRAEEGTGSSRMEYLTVIGTIEATIEVLDSTKGAMDSGNLKSHFEREYLVNGGGGFGIPGLGRSVSKGRPPTKLEQRDLVVEGLAAKVAQFLVSVEEDVEIQLPIGGQFKAMQEMARRKRWGELQEAAEQMPAPKKKEEDDAYRLYMIGLAYEGMAYDKAKTDPDAAKDLLTKAFGAYSEAKEKKPKETYFIQPEIRSQESLDAYIEIDHFRKLAAVTPKRAGSPSSTAGTDKSTAPVGTAQAASAGASAEWNNQTLIALKQKGLSDARLIALIKAAKNPKFDVDSPQGALELASFSDPVMAAITAKMHPSGGSNSPSPTKH
jgi:hypothetical protein